jgi:hypothetical protein
MNNVLGEKELKWFEARTYFASGVPSHSAIWPYTTIIERPGHLRMNISDGEAEISIPRSGSVSPTLADPPVPLNDGLKAGVFSTLSPRPGLTSYSLIKNVECLGRYPQKLLGREV